MERSQGLEQRFAGRPFTLGIGATHRAHDTARGATLAEPRLPEESRGVAHGRQIPPGVESRRCLQRRAPDGAARHLTKEVVATFAHEPRAGAQRHRFGRATGHREALGKLEITLVAPEGVDHRGAICGFVPVVERRYAHPAAVGLYVGEPAARQRSDGVIRGGQRLKKQVGIGTTAGGYEGEKRQS